MRKRLIVFTGGWGGEYFVEVLSGITESATQANIDVFAFVNFSVHADTITPNIPEVNFFKLPDLRNYDAAILLANSFNCSEELEYLKSAISEVHIPTLSVEYKLNNIPSIVTDNFSGMYDLTRHLVVEHDVRNLVYIGGPEDHPENHERLNAVKTVCDEYSISLPSTNIFYADWSKALIPSIINDYLKSNSLPDAFVCANDIMAIATCEQLKSLKILVPDDVIVTGFDCIRAAQDYDLPITSVNHEWFDMGRQAFEQIHSLMNNTPIVSNLILNTHLVKGGTCGCENESSRRRPMKTKLGRAMCDTIMDALAVDSHFRHFYRSVKGVDDAQSLHYSFSYLFHHEHLIEGKDFALFIDPELFNIVNDNSNLLIDGHRDKYLRVGALRNGEPLPLAEVTRDEALFNVCDNSPMANYYIYVPLYTEQYTLGFAILNGALNAANENQYYIWTRHMYQALEQVRSNITISTLYKKMEILSETDSLTGVYNRTGCETKLYPKLIDWTKHNGTSVVMLVDVDKMKLINDKYGHTSGDLALTIITKVLQKSLPEELSITRFGGDEFLILGCLDNPNADITTLIQKLENELDTYTQENNIEFPLGFSIGYSKITPTTQSDIEKGIVEADKNMYETKKLHHNE